MVSYSIECLTWVECEKKIWSHHHKKNVMFKFLFWNLSDDYNYKMNDNCIADKLWLVYCMMRFPLNEKWWWALFIWGFWSVIGWCIHDDASVMWIERCSRTIQSSWLQWESWPFDHYFVLAFDFNFCLLMHDILCLSLEHNGMAIFI